MLLSRLLSRGRPRWTAGLCTFGDLVVEERFVLPKASSSTASIIKVLHETDAKGLDNAELWDAIYEYKTHRSKGKMKTDLQQLKALGYVKYKSGRIIGMGRVAPYRALLTDKSVRALDDPAERERLLYNEGMPPDFEKYLLPGMDAETTHIVRIMVHSPKHKIYLPELWKKLELRKLYESFGEMRTALYQLRLSHYIKQETIRAPHWTRPRKLLALSDRVVVKNGQITGTKPFVRPAIARRRARERPNDVWKLR